MSRPALFLLFLITTSSFAQDRGMFVVTRDYRIRPFPEAATIVLDWKELQNHRSVPEQGDFDITDGNFGKKVTHKIVDINGDNQPDNIVIEYVFQSDEALYSFFIKGNKRPVTLSASTATPDARLKISYLSNNGEVAGWPDRIIGSAMLFNPEPALFNSDFAYFLTAVFNRWKETRNENYFNYLKKWADRLIDSHGYLNAKIYNVGNYNLEDVLAGRVFISLYEITKDARYKNAAQQLRQQLQYQPRTADGGYWYGEKYPYQMWLDGVYMTTIFLMQYAKAFNEPTLFREAMQQIRLVHKYNGDPETGMLYHGWDESGSASWSNEDTGTSRELWSRGIAWYYVALLECIDYIPLDYLERKEVGMMFRELTKAVQKYEDPRTALWYQVINKSFEPRNWYETSASAMFGYAFAKGHRNGILDKSYLSLAQKAFVSLQRDYIFFDDEGRMYLDGIARSATLDPKVSRGDLDYYLSTERRVNDYKGLGALLYLSMELD